MKGSSSLQTVVRSEKSLVFSLEFNSWNQISFPKFKRLRLEETKEMAWAFSSFVLNKKKLLAEKKGDRKLALDKVQKYIISPCWEKGT